MSKLEDKLAASMKTGRDARPSAKPAAKKQPARAKTAGSGTVADKASSQQKAETRPAPRHDRVSPPRASPEAAQDGLRPLHPHRVWPD